MSACLVEDCGAATKDATLCPVHVGEVERAVGDLPSLLHEASLLATGQTRTYRANNPVPYQDTELAGLEEEKAFRAAAIPARLRSRDPLSSLPSTRLPVNLDARELLADAYDTIAAQIVDLRDLANSEPKGWADAVPWLLRNLTTIAHHPAADTIHDELTFIHRRLERAVDRSPERIYAGPCRNTTDSECCNRPLYAQPRSERITCDGLRSDGIGCGATYSYAERQEWTLHAVKDAVLPINLWRTALPRMFPEFEWPRHRSTWGRWERSMEREGVSEQDVPMFSGHEVLAQMRKSQGRITGNSSKKRNAA